jgi:hypothetical protein
MKMVKQFAFHLVCALYWAHGASSASSTTWTVGQSVRTTSGNIIGHAAPNSSEVSEYLGIRYAQPPLEQLRFAAPKPYNSSADVIASTFVCLVLNHGSKLIVSASCSPCDRDQHVLLSEAIHLNPTRQTLKQHPKSIIFSQLQAQ